MPGWDSLLYNFLSPFLNFLFVLCLIAVSVLVNFLRINVFVIAALKSNLKQYTIPCVDGFSIHHITPFFSFCFALKLGSYNMTIPRVVPHVLPRASNAHLRVIGLASLRLRSIDRWRFGNWSIPICIDAAQLSGSYVLLLKC